ncbi:hypothetical protein [Mycobacterium leprae]|uniref:hypothetical protein n=1 Tax=Mycobacterium leprae TaxID=1769 RepID=UPI000309735C
MQRADDVVAAFAHNWTLSGGCPRTVGAHCACYVYAVLRRVGDVPSCLVISAEQDAIIRELLAGDLADVMHSATAWLSYLRPAVSTADFARELRNFLARCSPTRCRSAGVGATGPAFVLASRMDRCRPIRKVI